jgi:hypothetical protein
MDPDDPEKEKAIMREDIPDWNRHMQYKMWDNLRDDL